MNLCTFVEQAQQVLGRALSVSVRTETPFLTSHPCVLCLSIHKCWLAVGEWKPGWCQPGWSSKTVPSDGRALAHQHLYTICHVAGRGDLTHGPSRHGGPLFATLLCELWTLTASVWCSGLSWRMACAEGMEGGRG